MQDEFTEVTLLAEVVATQHAISTSDFDLDAVMSEIVTQTRRLTRADGAVVELVEGDEMVYRAVAGSSEPHAVAVPARARAERALPMSAGSGEP